jgi:hypothetical protein
MAQMTRAALHRLVDELPESALEDAHQASATLCETGVWPSLRDAPLEDEELSTSESAALDRWRDACR